MDKDIFDAIDSIKISNKQKDRIYKNILEKKESKSTPRKLIAITSICILLITTGMIVYNKLNMNFLSFLTDKNIFEPRSLESYIYNVDKTIEDKNGDLKIKQVLGDENISYIFMELESKNGQTFDISKDVNDDGFQDYWFASYDYTTEKFFESKYLSGGSALRMVATDNPHTLGIVASIDSSDKSYIRGSKGYTHHFEFRDLIKNSDDLGNGELVLPGKWKGKVNLKHKLIPSKKHKIKKNIKAYGRDFYIENIKISPLSMTLYSNIDRESFEFIEREMNKNNKSVEKLNIMNEDYFIKTKDGKLHKLFLESGLGDHMSGEMVLTFTFSEPIELSQIYSIVLLDQDITFK